MRKTLFAAAVLAGSTFMLPVLAQYDAGQTATSTGYTQSVTSVPASDASSSSSRNQEVPTKLPETGGGWGATQ